MKEKKITNTGNNLYKLFIYLVLGLLAVLILVPEAWRARLRARLRPRSAAPPRKEAREAAAPLRRFY